MHCGMDHRPNAFSVHLWPLISSLLRYPKTPCPFLCFSNCSDPLFLCDFIDLELFANSNTKLNCLVVGEMLGGGVGWGGAYCSTQELSVVLRTHVRWVFSCVLISSYLMTRLCLGFTLTQPLKGPVSKYNHILRSWLLMNLGHTIQVTYLDKIVVKVLSLNWTRKVCPLHSLCLWIKTSHSSGKHGLAGLESW